MKWTFAVILDPDRRQKVHLLFGMNEKKKQKKKTRITELSMFVGLTGERWSMYLKYFG